MGDLKSKNIPFHSNLVIVKLNVTHVFIIHKYIVTHIYVCAY